jgi:hypothetical protein
MSQLRDQSAVLSACSLRDVLHLDLLLWSFARVAAILVTLLCLANVASADKLVEIAGPMGPKLDIGKGGHCVRDPKFMRSNHFKLILHQREVTVREGVRGSKDELTNCVDCHASSVNHSVLGTNQNFCQGCHVYAAVKIDCFECHSSRPSKFMKASELAVEETK